MPNGSGSKGSSTRTLTPLPGTLQLGARVYQVLVENIVNGQMEAGAPLRPDAIARQLEVSTTPVREAMHRLELDGLAVKLPYQGWFVREFTTEQIRELYEFRAALEGLGVRLACQRITPEELVWLKDHQAAGQAALEASDIETYRVYNRDFHRAVLQAAKNSYLSSAMDQVALQTDMLTSRTVRITGRPLRAIEEHHQVIELIAQGAGGEAEQFMRSHIMSALDAILSLYPGNARESRAELSGTSRTAAQGQ